MRYGNNIKQLCDEHNIKVSTYYARIRAGWKQDKALLVPPLNRSTSNKAKSYYQQMLKKYGREKLNEMNQKSRQKRAKEKAVENAALAKFEQACGGYRAYILNSPKRGEFKYQLLPSAAGNKLLTNNLKSFIEAVIKTCDPQGRLDIKIIER